LAKKGHSPVKYLTGGRLSYTCPFPWHLETKPSFFVWTDAEYQNFYCFGCQSAYNIIHLASLYENLSLVKAMELLADGVEFSVESDEILEQADLNEKLTPLYLGSNYTDPNEQLAKMLIEISDICQEHLKTMNGDKDEQERIDGVWKLIDHHLMDCEIEKIEKIRSDIRSKLKKHRSVLAKKYKENLKIQYNENLQK
jgi:hypothetical protein